MNTNEIVDAWRSIIRNRNLKAQVFIKVFDEKEHIVFDFDLKNKILNFQTEIKDKFSKENIFVGIKLIENEPNQFAIESKHDPRDIKVFWNFLNIENNVQEINEVTLVENEKHEIVVQKVEVKQVPQKPYNYKTNSAREQQETLEHTRKFNQDQKDWNNSKYNKKGGIKRIKKEPIVEKTSIGWVSFIKNRGFDAESEKHSVYGHVILFKTKNDRDEFLNGSLLTQYKFARSETNPLKISTHFDPE